MGECDRVGYVYREVTESHTGHYEEKRRAALCQRYQRRTFTETLPCSAELSHDVARAQNGQIPGSSQSGWRLLGSVTN
jgi:hypothetical protein